MQKTYYELIHEASMQILGSVGMMYELPRAQEVLRANGIEVDEDGVAKFTEEQIMYWVNKAPHAFTIYARNPEHNIYVGGKQLNPAPGYGCPFVVDKNGKKREAVAEDYIKFTKLFHQAKSFHTNGGITVQPSDLPVDNATLLMLYMDFVYSDKTMLTGTADKEQVKAMMEFGKIAFGGAEEFAKYPRYITLINTVTPMTLTNVMTESLFEFVENGQPIIVGSLAQAGSTSPVTLAGSLAISNAEILAGIALAQMIRPGTPVVYGCETTTADLRSGATAIGSPEGAICYNFTGHMADFYGIPSRAGGCLSDAKKIDAQAGMESMITYMACREANINFMIHAAGIMDAYASMSYEKAVLDLEVIDYVERFNRYFDINEDTLPLDLIEEMGHDGVWLTEDHTFEFCRQEPLIPELVARGTAPVTAMEDNIEKKLNKMLDTYKKPELDPELLAKLQEVLINRGVSRELIDQLTNQ